VVEEERDGFVQWLSLIPGLGKSKIKNLVEAGYTTIESLKSASFGDISSIEGIGPSLAKRILDFVGKVEEGKKKAMEDLEELDKIWREEKPSLFLCTNCGGLISEGEKKCSVCGAEFEEDLEEGEVPKKPEPKKGKRIKTPDKEDIDGFWYKETPSVLICTNCGAIVSGHEERCGHCGAEFEEDEGEEEIQPEKKEKDKKPVSPDVDGYWYKKAPSLLICTNCGALVTSGERRCGHCGAEFEEDIKDIGELPRKEPSERPEKDPQKELEELIRMWDGDKRKPRKLKADIHGPPEEPSLFICPICGALASEGTKTCSVCGVNFEDEVQKVGVEKEEIEKPPDEERIEELFARPVSKRKKGVTKDFLKRWERVKEIEPEDTAKEIQRCDEILKNNPNDAETLKRKAYLLVKIGRFDEAIKTMEESQLIEPMSEEDYKLEVLNILSAKEGVPVIGLEEEMIDKSKVENALKHYDRLLKLDPTLEQAWQTKGELLEALGRRDEALDCYDRAIEARVARQTAKKLTALSALKQMGAFEAKPTKFVVKKELEKGQKGLVNATGRMNGLINGFVNGKINGLINGRGKVNDLVSGLINGNGLINGEGLYNGRGRIYKPRIKRSGEPMGRLVAIAASVIILILVTPILSSMMFVAPSMYTINIDGDFSDWSDIEGYDDLTGDQIDNNDVNIVRFKMHQEDNLASIYAMSFGTIFGGRHSVDTLLAFIDSDNDLDTGYDLRYMGADEVAIIQGWNNQIRYNAVHKFRDEDDRSNWSAFTPDRRLKVANDVNQVEIQFELTDESEAPRFLLMSLDSAMNQDVSDILMTEELGALKVIETTIAPEVVTNSTVPMTKLRFQSHGRSVILTNLNVSKEGNLSDSMITVYLYEDSNRDGLFGSSDELKGSSPVQDSRATFQLEERIDGEVTMFLIADILSGVSLRSFGLHLENVVSDAPSMTTREFETNVHLGQPLGIVVDGAFADWSGASIDIDGDDDQSIPLFPNRVNENADIREYGLNETQDEINFYMKVDGRMMGGVDAPIIGTRTPAPSQVTDVDRDTVPDANDEHISDFNNNGIPDAATGSDVDEDGIQDYPVGNDLWLNTTIPSDYPAPFADMNVTVYIGPISKRIIKGLDEVRIQIDSDGDPSTGLFTFAQNKSFGFDNLIVVTGRNEMIWSSELFGFNASSNVPWDYVKDVGSARDSSRLETSIALSDIAISSNYSVLFEIFDWNSRRDVSDDSLGTKSIDSEGTKSPAGDNVVLNEVSSVGSPEWIELANPTAGSIDLSGWTIQRKQGGGWVTLYTFSGGTSIGAWGSGSEYLTVDLGANSLPDKGANIRLMDATSTEVDATKYAKLGAGQTWARYKDGTDGKPVDTDSDNQDWYKSSSPSKGGPNDEYRPRITVGKVADLTEASPGDTIIYTINYDNTGDGVANDVWINDTLPADVTLISSSVPYDSFSGQTYRWHFTNVAPGTNSFTITVSVNDDVVDETSMDNSVTLDYTDQLGRPMESSSDTYTTICARPIVTIVKVTNKDTAVAGERITYTVYYNNTGSGNAGNIWVNDTLPQGVTFFNAVPSPDSTSGRTLRWHFTDVKPGNHKITIKVDVNATVPDPVLANMACLNYTTLGGVDLTGSCDTAVTVVPEYHEVVVPIFGIMVIILAVRMRRKKEDKDG
jgi:uncharacterized repeat protein (TIGR01451 family)